MICIKTLENKLKANGYKITPQRRAILEVLINYTGHFISAEKIHLEVNKDKPKLNITTIYRNLEILFNINIVHKIHREEGVSHYGIICTDSHHHHVICKSCGKTEIIDYCPLEKFADLAERKNFTLTDHKIELYGYCEKCRHKK